MGISQYTEVLKQWNYTKPKSLAEALVYIFYIFISVQDSFTLLFMLLKLKEVSVKM